MSQEHLRSEAWSAVTGLSEHAGRPQQGGAYVRRGSPVLGFAAHDRHPTRSGRFGEVRPRAAQGFLDATGALSLSTASFNFSAWKWVMSASTIAPAFPSMKSWRL